MRGLCALTLSIAFFGCASRPAQAPRAAERDVAASDEPAAAPAPVPSTSASEEDRPAGERVCRAAKSGGTVDLYLKWEGDEASGVLRETTPSGMVHDLRVRAERSQGLVVVDDPHERDLVAHAAVVAKGSDDKKRMKIGDAWATCE